MTRVKICGTCSEAALETSVEAGADALGFVVEYPDPVPWNLDREKARQLIDRVPPFVSTTLVTTGTVENVTTLVTECRPDAVQLHGDEGPETVREVTSQLDTTRVDILKATPVDPEADRSDLLTVVREFVSCGIDGIVLDAKAEDRRGGGTGRTVSWSLARQMADEVDAPIVLAGGLTPDNVGEAVETVQPYAVDVISGVERRESVKCPERLNAFVDAVADARDRYTDRYK
ncbi:MAG: phosphoribosylanthranilate isomerase [Halococcoides sp.]